MLFRSHVLLLQPFLVLFEVGLDFEISGVFGWHSFESLQSCGNVQPVDARVFKPFRVRMKISLSRERAAAASGQVRPA